VNPTVDFWQLLLVDILFLAVASSLGLWFRAWLLRERRLLDDRLVTLEQHQSSLERVANRLQAACLRLENLADGESGLDASPTSTRLPGRRQSPSAVTETGEGAGRAGGRSSGSPESAGVGVRGADEQSLGVRRDEREERYDRARALLAQGKEPGFVARQIGLGIAEVELMARILHQNTPR